jgi:hypothetical protein
MAVKKIEILVPSDDIVLDIGYFTPEENYIMLKMGSGYIFEGLNAGACRTHREICQKLGDISWNNIGQQEKGLLSETTSAEREIERTTKLYEEKIYILEGKIEKLKSELLKYGVAL